MSKKFSIIGLLNVDYVSENYDFFAVKFMIPVIIHKRWLFYKTIQNFENNNENNPSAIPGCKCIKRLPIRKCI